MSERITMPQLGETVTEGTILRWLVNVGDSIKEDDPILEISTDKVDTEVPSPFSGTVSALLVEEGETVEVGSPLLELDGEESSEDVINDTNDVVEEVVEAPTDQNPVQEIVENEENSIIVASYGTFSTGINIRNIDNIVFASPSKSKIRVLQSLGRGLRRGDKSKSLKVFDISDDLATAGGRLNFTLRHFKERINIYDEQRFDYEIRRINLK